jgi:hypothetical protein
VAKTQVDEVPLWSLVLAAYSNDLLKYGFSAVGLETSSNSFLDLKRGVYILFPGNISFSHGLFMSIVWSFLAAGIAYLFFHNRRISSIFGLVVISHWFLDFLAHPPELPLLFNHSPLVGLGLWETPSKFIIASFLEVAMVAGGLIMYFNHRMHMYFRRS